MEEGEIRTMMNEALGTREQKRRTNEMSKTEYNDFYTYYNKIFYDKYNNKDLNDSMYIIKTKKS